MVNNQHFAERLEKMMSHYSLSASSFSEKIGVARSSISHILSGRNKPSLDFILKILKEFPEVNLYWLMNGKGRMFVSKESVSSNSPSPLPTKVESKKPSVGKENLVKEKGRSTDSVSKTIDKVIIFYTDGSFESFEDKD
ncbi:MAG TPA: helix-turn-helix transcriptional regulator [Flavobacteriaceae bacterium]|nr:helix-turn-helix transcriptional regulator [Flavobacteriaceae bacterium]